MLEISILALADKAEEMPKVLVAASAAEAVRKLRLESSTMSVTPVSDLGTNYRA